MTTQRTYWHLEGQKRVPSSYEIGTSRLLYYPGRGFEVATPVAAWYQRHQQGSRLQATWEGFSDPRATTYADYVRIARERESFVDGILTSIDETGYDEQLAADWVGVLEAVLPVLRFPGQGLHMLASYVGHMAPEGRLVVACAFQAADELRRVQRLAYRMRQLQNLRADFGARARHAWQEGLAWQPLRELIERLLVTYDFGEAMIANNLVAKPAFDELFMRQFARVAIERGDRLLAEVVFSLEADCRWHRQWADACVTTAVRERPLNLEPMAEWVARWWPLTRRAISALVLEWGLDPSRAREVVAEVEATCRGRWSALGIACPDASAEKAGADG